MKRLEAITPHKRKKDLLLVKLDDGTAVELRAEAVAAHGLSASLEIADARWEAILRDDQLARCRHAAWRLLSVRPRSEKELVRALRQRKHAVGIAEAVAEELRSKGYLDDAAFAKQFAAERAQRRQGPRLIEQELASRGIGREEARRVAGEAASAEDQRRDARALLEKWNRRSKPEDVRKRVQAAAAFLMRRGYDSEIVWETVREFFRTQEE